jgi:hypothetical protein
MVVYFQPRLVVFIRARDIVLKAFYKIVVTYYNIIITNICTIVFKFAEPLVRIGANYENVDVVGVDLGGVNSDACEFESVLILEDILQSCY